MARVWRGVWHPSRQPRGRGGGAALWLAISLALCSGPADGHPGHGDGVYAALVGVDKAPPGAVGLRVLIVNNTPGAATLRRLALTGDRPVAIVRHRHLFGLELRQPVNFLRLESGERVLLAGPDYSVTADGLDIDAVIRGDIELLADFGPLGIVPLEVLGGPQTSE